MESKINQIITRFENIKDNVLTEEATKNSFILPFISSLGYDVFDITEVNPEFTADSGTKKNEKVDYAIMNDGIPSIIIECKHWKDTLNTHYNQLFRYFSATVAKFAILTNGIVYKFYTDLVKENIMDDEPFLEFNILELNNYILNELEQFSKDVFNIENVLKRANDLKYINGIKSTIIREIKSPTKEFIKVIAKQVHSGLITPKVIEKLEPIIINSFSEIISLSVDKRLHAAISKETDKKQLVLLPETPNTTDIVTTEDELESYHIVKAILSEYTETSNIKIKDVQSYCGILFQYNNRKPLCRLYFNSSIKYLGIFDENRKETKIIIENISDIYKYKQNLITTLSLYTEISEMVIN